MKQLMETETQDVNYLVVTNSRATLAADGRVAGREDYGETVTKYEDPIKQGKEMVLMTG